MASKLRPYNKEEWQKITQDFLLDHKTPSTALHAAYIALRVDDPELAQKAKEAALWRKNHRS